MLRLYQDITNGPTRKDLPVRSDLTWIEGLAVAPLLVALLLVGVYPKPLLTNPAVSTVSSTPPP
jgi:NADH:ubiquinone oxidoreductase subunit 4 (subunit M)